MDVYTQDNKYGRHNSKTVSVRLPLDIYDRLVMAADRDNLSPGQFVRDAALEEIRLSEEKIMAG
jgi:predicted DNA-binding protein